MKKNVILIVITIVMYLLFISGCRKESDIINGDDHFLYTKYIGKNDEAITGINIPFISKEKIEVIELLSVDMSIKDIPTFYIEGYQEIGNYKDYYAYVIYLDITHIAQSFVINKMNFEINNKHQIEYNPKSFIVVKTDYEVINYDEFKLLTSIIKFNNVPSRIKYQIDSDDYKIIDIKSLHLIDKWETFKDFDYTNTLSEYIIIDINKIEINQPLYVNFNFQFIVDNGIDRYVYIDNIEINLLYIEAFEEVLDGEM